MAYEYILSERLDGVALVTLNRPDKLNALSFPLMQEVDDALTGYEADDAVAAVILTGAGERAFFRPAPISTKWPASPPRSWRCAARPVGGSAGISRAIRSR